ncbi:unnamed protein product [Chrysoparadoxa australica]
MSEKALSHLFLLFSLSLLWLCTTEAFLSPSWCHAVQKRSQLQMQLSVRGGQEGVISPRSRREVLSRAMITLVALGSGPVVAFADLASDEFEVVFDSDAIGLELQDVKFKGSTRVLVKRVVQGSPAAKNARIAAGLVLVSAGGQSLERSSAKTAREIIKGAPRPLSLVFRDPSLFRELIDGGQEAGGAAISTEVAPQGSKQERQVLSVDTTSKSESCPVCTGVRRGDLLEILYTGKLEDGTVFDGSNIKIGDRGVAGRGGDRTLYFVLGQQPVGQFPPGWDVGLQGMCQGERRIVTIPPVLAYGARGLPKRGIPPNATLVYDVELVSVNGVNLCN